MVTRIFHREQAQLQGEAGEAGLPSDLSDIAMYDPPTSDKPRANCVATSCMPFAAKRRMMLAALLTACCCCRATVVADNDDSHHAIGARTLHDAVADVTGNCHKSIPLHTPKALAPPPVISLPSVVGGPFSLGLALMAVV